MVLRIVVILYPCLTETIEFFQRSKTGIQGEKAIPKASKKSLNFSLGGTISNGRMRKMNI
jgi:hypothetical protein